MNNYKIGRDIVKILRIGRKSGFIIKVFLFAVVLYSPMLATTTGLAIFWLLFFMAAFDFSILTEKYNKAYETRENARRFLRNYLYYPSNLPVPDFENLKDVIALYYTSGLNYSYQVLTDMEKNTYNPDEVNKTARANYLFIKHNFKYHKNEELFRLQVLFTKSMVITIKESYEKNTGKWPVKNCDDEAAWVNYVPPKSQPLIETEAWARSVLGVDQNADKAAITSAWRKLVKSHHPDVNKSPDASDLFIKIQKAYEILN